VIVDLISEAGFADLIEAVKGLQVDSAAIREEQSPKGDCESRLAETAHGGRVAKRAGTGWNQQVLAVGGVDGRGDETVDRASEGSIETVRQNRLDEGTFGDAVGALARPMRRSSAPTASPKVPSSRRF